LGEKSMSKVPTSKNMEIVDAAARSYAEYFENPEAGRQFAKIGYHSLSAGLSADESTAHLRAARMVIPYIQAPINEVLGVLAAVYADAAKTGKRTALKLSARPEYENQNPAERLGNLVTGYSQNGARKLSAETLEKLAVRALVKPFPTREFYRAPKDHPSSSGRKINGKSKGY
jgi:hypothetical protein